MQLTSAWYIGRMWNVRGFIYWQNSNTGAWGILPVIPVRAGRQVVVTAKVFTGPGRVTVRGFVIVSTWLGPCITVPNSASTYAR
jgi:hypothetical protein